MIENTPVVHVEAHNVLIFSFSLDDMIVSMLEHGWRETISRRCSVGN
jgi:hypothetical protein